MELVYIYPSFAPCYLLDTAHTESLTVLYGSNEIAGFEQTVAVTRIKPGETTAEKLYFQRTFFQIKTIEVGNFIFTAGGRFQSGGFFRPFFGKIMNFLQNDKKGLILSEKNRNI